MRKKVRPTVEIEVDITQPTRCSSLCQFMMYDHPGNRCQLFAVKLRAVRAKNDQKDTYNTLIYIHRCKQCRQAEVA